MSTVSILTLSQTTNFRFSKIFPKQQILDFPKLKEFADNNLNFDEKGEKFSKRVQKAVGKREILVKSTFSFSHSVFKRLVLQTCKSQSLFGKGLIRYIKNT